MATGRVPAEPDALPMRLRAALRVKHSLRLSRDVTRFAAQEGAWWLIPLVVVLAIVAAVVTTTSTVLPYGVYTLF